MREKIQGESTTDNSETEGKKSVRDSVNSYMPKNWNTQKKMDKFLKTCNLTKLNQEEMDYLNRLINSSEIDFVI